MLKQRSGNNDIVRLGFKYNIDYAEYTSGFILSTLLRQAD